MQISVSKQIHADLAHQHGFLGEGIGIAYLDTGLFPHKISLRIPHGSPNL